MLYWWVKLFLKPFLKRKIFKEIDYFFLIPSLFIDWSFSFLNFPFGALETVCRTCSGIRYGIMYEKLCRWQGVLLSRLLPSNTAGEGNWIPWSGFTFSSSDCCSYSGCRSSRVARSWDDGDVKWIGPSLSSCWPAFYNIFFIWYWLLKITYLLMIF